MSQVGMPRSHDHVQEQCRNRVPDSLLEVQHMRTQTGKQPDGDPSSICSEETTDKVDSVTLGQD